MHNLEQQQPTISQLSRLDSKQQSSSFIQTLNKNNNNIKLKMKCKSNNKIHSICINKKCTKTHPFLCSNSECDCYHLHKGCSTGNFQSPLKNIQQKINNENYLIKLIEDVFINLVNQLSILEDQIKIQVKQKAKFLCLSEEERSYYDVVSGNLPENYFTGEKLEELWRMTVNNNKKKIEKYQQSNDKLAIVNGYYKQVLNFSQLCISYVSPLKEQLSVMLVEQQKVYNEKIIKCRLAVEYLDSNIVKEKDKLEKIISFFEPERKVHSLNVRFKASENQFSLKRFFEKYGELDNMIIIAKSEEEKVFGAYTPLKHQFTGEYKKGIFKWEEVPDASETSFIFSLTNDEKFRLKGSNQAIVRYLDKSKIQFGFQEFVIGDHCDTEPNCYTWNICTPKSCYKYSQNYSDDQKMQVKRLRLNGVNQDKIKLKQWQCWSIKFQRQKKQQ